MSLPTLEGPLAEPRLRVVLEADGERRGTLLQTLLEGGVQVTAAGESGGVAPLDDDPLLVLRDEAAAGEELPLSGDVPGRGVGVGGLDAPGVLELARNAGQSHTSGGWKPWFPVIDYDRCTNCMQCMSFCLFGVYDVDDGQQIDVAHPDRCKTNCPACSRVCPEVAILFPKYRHGPINGDVVQAKDVEREKMKVDVSSLLGGDIYSLLKKRSERAKSRFSRERDDERALKERQRCLKKLKDQLDIPDDVLEQLPSAEQIQANAAARREAKKTES
ncbi:MAG: 4Fe-4S binding protein [Acidobacteriota bacterium]